jgi:hypothetical protein
MKLQTMGLGGRLPRPELADPRILALDDNEIIKRFNVPLYAVKQARIKFGLQRYVKIDLARRRTHLSMYLFGLPPGPNFTMFVNELLYSKMKPIEAELLQRFYLSAGRECDHRERIYRKHAKNRLKKLVDNQDVNELIRLGVLFGRELEKVG